MTEQYGDGSVAYKGFKISGTFSNTTGNWAGLQTYTREHELFGANGQTLASGAGLGIRQGVSDMGGVSIYKNLFIFYDDDDGRDYISLGSLN